MPNLEVTFQKGNGVYGREAFVAAKALMQEEMEKHPEWAFTRDPEFRDTSSTLTVVQPYKIDLAYVAPEPEEEPEVEEEVEDEEPEPEEEPEEEGAITCEAVKSDGNVCGRDLPCRYHK